MTDPANDGDEGVRLAFDRDFVTIPISAIKPLRILPDGIFESRKFLQILSSVSAIGLVEAPVVLADATSGSWFLLDGHLRVEALKQLGVESVDCLSATEDDTYTYNRRVNRLTPVQEHRMIVRAIERGVSSVEIAAALRLQEEAVAKRRHLLRGICPEVAETLKNAPCSMRAFDVLRQMSALRQIEAAELMIGQKNFSLMFVRALRAATPDDQLAASKKGKSAAVSNAQQMARMERELAALQTQVKSVEDDYGLDTLHLTVARGYVVKLLDNARVRRWLEDHRQEYLAEFQKIANVETLAGWSEVSGAEQE